MAALKVGIIGCGRPRTTEGATGFGMAHYHAQGYAAAGAQIVALADVNLENAQAFQAEHGGERLYTEYREMLARESLDLVSVCTWPHLHAEMVIAAAEAGVRAIHCEKPVAPTYGQARRMVRVCREQGVQLTFNHQRRFSKLFRTAKELLTAGAIGELQRIEAGCGNMFDWGTHWFDMFFFYNNETPAEWVLGQIDLRDGPTVFGVRLEGQGMSLTRFSNGVQAFLLTGYGVRGAYNRLFGSDGMLEVSLGAERGLRIWNNGRTTWEQLDVLHDEGGDLGEPVRLGVRDLVDALTEGREPELSAARALRATELIFATYESSRRRGRVDLPLDIDDSPLQELLEAA